MQLLWPNVWDFTPSKILEHFGFESTRHTAAKFKPCKGIDRDEHKDVKATVQRIHAAEFAAKSALKLAKGQGSRTQQAAYDEFFHVRGVSVQAPDQRSIFSSGCAAL